MELKNIPLELKEISVEVVLYNQDKKPIASRKEFFPIKSDGTLVEVVEIGVWNYNFEKPYMPPDAFEYQAYFRFYPEPKKYITPDSDSYPKSKPMPGTKFVPVVNGYLKKRTK
jgi:hypothetical protein